MSNMSKMWRDFRKATDGTLSVWTALAAIPLISAVTFTLDLQGAVGQRDTLKSALDTAVLAAVNHNALSIEEKKAFAIDTFMTNYNGTATVTSTRATADANTVSLSVEASFPKSVSSAFGAIAIDVNVESAATLNEEETICVLALDEEAEGAITFEGDISYMSETCSVHANSTADIALVSDTKGVPLARSFCTPGGAEGYFSPGANGECRVIGDPYEGKRAPVENGCTVLSHAAIVSNIGLLANHLGLASLGSNPVANAALGPATAAIWGDDDDDYGDDDDDDDNGLSGYKGLGFECVGDIDACNLVEQAKLKDGEKKHENHGHFAEALDVCIAEGDCTSLTEKLADPLGGPISVSTAALQPRAILSDDRIITLMEGDSPNVVDNNAVITPGTYCGGLTIAGRDVVLPPGEYYMKDGPLVVKDGATVEGRGVIVALGGNGSVLKVESGGAIDVTAPRTGAFGGIAIMEDTRAENTLLTNGDMALSRIADGSLKVGGTVYLPSHQLVVTGEKANLGAIAPSTSLIVGKALFKGDGMIEISVDHRAAGLPAIQPRSEAGARLVR